MRKAYDWLEERIELSKYAWLGTRIVPRGVTWWYVFGSATLIAFTLLVVTGAFLMFNYDPSPTFAYASVQFINHDVAFGSLVQSIHHWSAYAIVLLVALHALRVFFFAAYRYPREVSWITGVLLLLLVGGMAFTGYLLPWDQRAYWATVVGTNIAQETPFIGHWLKALLIGGSAPGSPQTIATPALALTRFFALHVAILPALLVIVISIHLFLVVRLGISEPPSSTVLACDTGPSAKTRKEIYEEEYKRTKEGGHPFVPDVIFHDTVMAVIVVATIFILAIVVPMTFVGPANAVGTAFSPKPEWYFVWLQTWLRLFPGKLEPVGAILAPLVGIGLIMLLPFFDRGLNRTFSARKALVGIGAFAVAFVLVLEIYGFFFPPTVAVPKAPPPPPGANYGQVAALGKTAYEDSCASCHGVNGAGVVAPALWGSKATLGTYNGATLYSNNAAAMLSFISSTMPVGAPGTLPHTTYLDILAYLMVQNGLVPSSTTFNESQLSSILLTAHTTTPTPAPTTAPPATTTPSPTPTASPTTTPTTFQTLGSGGQVVYSSDCAVCHGADGQGGIGPPLWGTGATLGTYNGISLYSNNAAAMLTFMTNTMPLTKPGTLTHEQYVDVLAYILLKGGQVSPSSTFVESQLGSIPLK